MISEVSLTNNTLFVFDQREEKMRKINKIKINAKCRNPNTIEYILIIISADFVYLFNQKTIIKN